MSSTPQADALARSLALCRDITRTQAGNFYHGLKLTPEPRRSAMYAVYAWMRAADDLADAPEAAGAAPGTDKAARLARFREWTQAACAGLWHPALGNDAVRLDPAIWPAVQHAFTTYHVPLAPLEDMIRGQLRDQAQRRYATLAELEDYCYQVAGTVGLVCLSVWGYEGGAATQKLAVTRGLALQLTNIVRDVVEDATRDRVYLPQDVLARHGLDADKLAAQLQNNAAPGNAVPTALVNVLREMVQRAGAHYQTSAVLERSVDAASRPTCWALGEIYHELWRRIAADPGQVLHGRVRVPKWKKLAIGLRATLGTPWAR